MWNRFAKSPTVIAVSLVLTVCVAPPSVAAETEQAEPDFQLEDNQGLLTEVVEVVDKMKDDPDLGVLLKAAKGVYIVPNFGRAGLVVGGSGGSGVVLFRRSGEWGEPAFFDFGAASLGLQAGVSGGSAVFLLMSDESLAEFQDGNVFSFNAEAGFTIIDYSESAQASYGKGDIVFWTDTEGAYAGATASLSDIVWNDDRNQALYGPDVTAAEVLGGNADPKESVKALKHALTEMPRAKQQDPPPMSEEPATIPIEGLTDSESDAIEPAVVSTAELQGFGAILVDGGGHPLYLFEGDEQGADSSDCKDTCADDWPALLTKGEPDAQQEAKGELISTIDRKDDAKQVTYNGWPLYRYNIDVSENGFAAKGQGVKDAGARWYLVTPDGKRAKIE